MKRYLPVKLVIASLLTASIAQSQSSVNTIKTNTRTFGGIEVGSKGVKLSIIEMGENSQNNGDFNILKDSSVNTDFISFNSPTFSATLSSFCGLFNTAEKSFGLPSKKIFTVISSGVKMQADKENKSEWIDKLIDSFRLQVREPNRRVEIVDVAEEARLSHMGIVPDSKRFNTFLIDIGSGNTKGGFFPYSNLDNFRLFQLNWGTKSATNATDKVCADKKNLEEYHNQLTHVLNGAENTDIIYAVNASGSYPMSDNIAISGGIAWASANLLHPELVDNPVVPVSYEEIAKFCEALYNNPDAFTASFLSENINYPIQREKVKTNVAAVLNVFDQKQLMAGAGLMLKIMRQFAPVNGNKKFFLIKNGQVGWISAYVDETVNK